MDGYSCGNECGENAKLMVLVFGEKIISHTKKFGFSFLKIG